MCSQTRADITVLLVCHAFKVEITGYFFVELGQIPLALAVSIGLNHIKSIGPGVAGDSDCLTGW